ncbi:MAG TPA: S-layer homology domain-containing protein [Candidatus Obscuribacterales bacterium]
MSVGIAPSPQGNGIESGDGADLLAQTASAAVLTSLEHAGGYVTLSGRNASRGQLMRSSGDRLRVPRRSRANIGFRPNQGSGTLAGYRVQAGSATRDTEYWYPCNGRYGQFVMGWSAGQGTASTCSQVRLGQTLNVRAHVKGLAAAVTKPNAPHSERLNSLKANFPDTSGHWAAAEIDALSNLGVVSGYYEDGTFRPNAAVTRAEFAAMVNKAFSDRPASRSGRDFPDAVTHWGSSAIRNAYALGFISGYPEGDFRPNWNVTRVEAMVALATGLELTGSTSLYEVYSDADQICGASARYWWACNQITAAASNGIRIQGPNPSWFGPAQQATRADVAVFIYQALQRSANPWGSGEGEDAVTEPTDDSAAAEIIVEPSSADATWVLADVTETGVEVIVLGGAALVGLATDPELLPAGHRYSLSLSATGEYQEKVALLSPAERQAIATSAEVSTFLDPNSWLPEDISDLPQYQVYRDALLGNAATSQPLVLLPTAVNLVERTSSTTGRVQIVGTVINQSQSTYSAVPGPQWIQVSEPAPESGPVPPLVRRDFQTLGPGETIQVVYEMDWDTASFQGHFGYLISIPSNASSGQTLFECMEQATCDLVERDEINQLFNAP